MSSTLSPAPGTRNRLAAIIFLAQSFFSASIIAAFTLTPIVAVDLSGTGSLFWRIMSLVGHRLPAGYADELSAMMREAGLSTELLPTDHRQYIFIRAVKESSG